MEAAKTVFLEFLGRTCHLVHSVPRYSRKELATLASYFWERFTSDCKMHWKHLALQRRQEGGSRKLRGFWLFALTLEKALSDFDTNFLNFIWINFTDGAKDYWLPNIDSILNFEFEAKLFKLY